MDGLKVDCYALNPKYNDEKGFSVVWFYFKCLPEFDLGIGEVRIVYKGGLKNDFEFILPVIIHITNFFTKYDKKFKSMIFKSYFLHKKSFQKYTEYLFFQTMT